MSKPVHVHAGSSRPCSPAGTLLSAPRVSPRLRSRRLCTASLLHPLLHRAPAVQHRLADQDADPACQDLRLHTSVDNLEYEISAYGCTPSLVRPMTNVYA